MGKWLIVLLSLISGNLSAQSTEPCEELKKKQDEITEALLKANEYALLAMTRNPFALSESEDDPYTYNDSAYHMLDSLLQLPQIINYDLECLLESIEIQYSKDERFWILSWDENTGGSFQSSVTILHGRGEGGKVFQREVAETPVENEEEEQYEKYIGGDLWGQIVHQIDAPGSTSYIVEETAKTCNTCIWWGIAVYRVSDSGDVIEYQNIGKGARWANLDGSYDTTTKIITLRYIVDDQNNDEEQTNVLNKYTGRNIVHTDELEFYYMDKLITETWEFTGNKFELIKVIVEEGELWEEE